MKFIAKVPKNVQSENKGPTIRIKIRKKVEKQADKPRQSDEIGQIFDKGRTNTAFGVFRVYKHYPNEYADSLWNAVLKFLDLHPGKIFVSCYGECNGEFHAGYFSLWFSEENYTYYVEEFEKIQNGLRK